MKKCLLCLFTLLAALCLATPAAAIPDGGPPLGFSESTCPNQFIPDLGSFQSTVTFVGTGALVTASLNVDIELNHTCPPDFLAWLTSPSGTTVQILDHDLPCCAPGAWNIPGGIVVDLSVFVGEPLDGVWTLDLDDDWGGDTGSLVCWGVNDPDAVAAGTTWDFEDGTLGDWYVMIDPNIAMMQNVLDPDEGDRVIELRAATMDTWFALADVGGADLAETNTVLQWSMKPQGLLYFYVEVDTVAGPRRLYYTPNDADKLLQGAYIHHGISYNYSNGQWSTFVRDLAADLDEAEPGNTITAVKRFCVRATSIRIDDISLLAAIPVGWDSDYDGLTDAEELATYGTNRYDADTDDDGLNDGPEAAIWGVDWNANPDLDGSVNLLDTDSDNDGFSDGVEVNAGSDPADADSVPAVARDFEDGSTAGWYVASGLGAIVNRADAENRTLVTELRSPGTSTLFGLVRRDGTLWHDNVNTTFSWKMKFAKTYYLYVEVLTTAGLRYMYYTPHDVSYGARGIYMHYGLGAASKDGTWQSFTRDLAADLTAAEPGNTIIEVNRFYVRGCGRIDDVLLAGGAPPPPPPPPPPFS